jgi:hypothetical protein
MGEFEKQIVEQLAAIKEQLKHIPTRDEVKDIIAERTKPDWAGRAKFAATLVGSGGIGAAVIKIVEMLAG